MIVLGSLWLIYAFVYNAVAFYAVWSFVTSIVTFGSVLVYVNSFGEEIAHLRGTKCSKQCVLNPHFNDIISIKGCSIFEFISFLTWSSFFYSSKPLATPYPQLTASDFFVETISNFSKVFLFRSDVYCCLHHSLSADSKTSLCLETFNRMFAQILNNPF